MNNFRTYSLLLLIPVILFFTAKILRETEGPFYFNTGYDPNYVYAVSSLNLINSDYAVHTDHPGSAVQIFGAFVMLLSGKSTSEITEFVLTDPESYLSKFHIALIIFYSLCTFLCGFLICRITGKLFLGILMQISPFLSVTLLYELTQTIPEIFVSALMMLFIPLLFSYRSALQNSESDSYKLVIYFSIISGICLSAKITFLPVIVIPLIILKGFKNKLLFLILSVILFFAVTYPVMGTYEYFFKWIKNLITHDGLYGTGQNVIFNVQYMTENFSDIFFKDPVYMIVFFSAVLVITFFKINPSDEYDQNVIDRKILKAIVASIAIQILFASKHYSQHYIVPTLILIPLAIYLILKIIAPSRFFRFNFESISSQTLLITSLVLISSVSFFTAYTNLSELNKESKLLIDFLESKNNSDLVVNSYGASDMEYALKFSMNWAGKNKVKYESILEKKSNYDFCIEFWDNELSFCDPEFNESQLLKNQGPILLRHKLLHFNDKAVEIFNNYLNKFSGTDIYSYEELISIQSGESVYRFFKK